MWLSPVEVRTMAGKKWTFLSNHGHVFAYVAQYPQSTIEEIAFKAGLSVWGVQKILKVAYSDRKASMGLRRDACHAG